MPRKSSSVAAGYAKSAKRKKGKRRSSTRAPNQTPVAPAPNVRPVREATSAVSPGAGYPEPSRLATAAVKAGTPRQEATAEYGYVLQELKKIGVVAALLLAIIIALAFFLR